jgi:hypothetical protein
MKVQQIVALIELKPWTRKMRYQEKAVLVPTKTLKDLSICHMCALARLAAACFISFCVKEASPCRR